MQRRLLKMIGIFLLLGASSAWASPPPWGPTGDHTFTDLDAPFTERSVFGTATLTISGGSFEHLYCYDYSTVNMSGGIGYNIGTDDHSILNLRGGSVRFLSAINVLFWPNYSQINIYALDRLISHDIYPDYYHLTGHWENGSTFDILINDPSWPNVNIHVIPEPCTFFLLACGVLFLKRRLA